MSSCIFSGNIAPEAFYDIYIGDLIQDPTSKIQTEKQSLAALTSASRVAFIGFQQSNLGLGWDPEEYGFSR